MADEDFRHSSIREKIAEHVFVGEVCRTLWTRGIHEIEVLRSETDSSGYDIVIEARRVMRHIQLKAMAQGAKTTRWGVHEGIVSKPSGCVIVLRLTNDMRFDEFLWYGSAPGQPCPSLSSFPRRKHSKANALGEKTIRPRVAEISVSAFTRLASADAVVTHLFGDSN
ncbi:hypothetical protein [Elioraea sp.]|uniref:hypothetical protein n=1 Tax=Elioraea sp. TaxID=2185103 RepID=UPI003F6FD043